MRNFSKIAVHFKQILFFIIAVGIAASSFAQPFNNSWINYSQQYYKFKIAKTGIYRLDSSALANSGIPISTINPQNIQLFARGVEVPIHIEGEVDGVFNNNDFIEFYGEYNDGWLDEPLYGGVSEHPSPYYSLFNDTISYYLTWNTSTSNNRLVLETDINFGAYTPINSFDKERVQVFSDGAKVSNDPYYDGIKNVVDNGLFGYSSTEGWFDNGYKTTTTGNGVRTKTINTVNAYSLGGDAQFKAVVVSWSDPVGVTIDHHLRVDIGSGFYDTTFAAYKKIDVDINIPVTDLGTNTTQVNFTAINDLGAGANDRQAVAYLTLKYPHNMDLEAASVFDKIYLNDHPSQTLSLFEFSNFNSTGEVLFYDITNNKRIQVMPNGAGYRCLVPNSGGEKECFISADNQITNITSLIGVNGGSATFTDYGAAPIDTAYIIITHPNLLFEANTYANYRLNPPVNALNIPQQNAVVYNIDDLYDQFAYGIEKHPYSIRGFIDYISNTWPTVPNYLFLIGKSVKSSESRRNLTAFHENLVPSFGDPASDNLLTAGLNGTYYEPLVPTGRLAAKNGAEVDWYRQKVEDHESHDADPNGGAAWMKNFLHFAGGFSAAESSGFLNSLNTYKTTIEDTLFAGDVSSFSKSSTTPIQNTLSDSIRDFIGEGVSMMTFFGHASTSGGFDQNIDAPSTWPAQNGKYPLVMGLACHTGDVHTALANSTSEEYVLIDDKGAIAFFSSVDLGVSSVLNSYAGEFYRNLAYKNYKGSLGRSIKNTIINTQSPFSSISLLQNSTALSMTLHGDPAVSLNAFELPDYMIQNSSITFNPSVITSDIDSFEVSVFITNLGAGISDSVSLRLNRDFPGATFGDTAYVKSFPGAPFQNTVIFKLPVDQVRGLGLNTFTIEVDAINQVVELSEGNNSVTIDLNIRSGEIIPVYPYEFMIVPDSTDITLKASTAFPFEPAKDYLFQIDTTDYFNSPVLETTTINAPGGVVSWTPNLPLTLPDSTVYFWRISKDSLNPSGYTWRNRSFQYIKGKEGWQQDHFFQFENNDFQFVDHQRALRQYEFVDDVKELRGVTQVAESISELFPIGYFLNTTTQGSAGSGISSSLHVAVIDSLTLEPWSVVEHSTLGHVNNTPNFIGSAQERIFIFRQGSAANMASLENMLRDSVPPGNHVLMWTWYYYNYSGYTPMPASLKSQLGNMGATQLSNVSDSLPFLFYNKIGTNSSTVEVIGDSIFHKMLTLNTSISSSANYGNIHSQILGPATRWDSLSWRVNPIETPTSKDSTVLNVFGVDAGGNETLIISNLPTDSGDVQITNQINANQYPYLKLNAYITDDSLFTAPQLDRWQVTFDGAPEAALEPSINFSFMSDTVSEGEDVSVSIAVKNISRYDMDSLLISFSVLDRNNDLHIIPYSRQKPLLADSVIIAQLNIPTLGLGGLNSLLIEVNPNNDQLEQYHFNNLAQIPFYVTSDNINPLLDVTFDGVHILDGDIVSPKATIVIELTDENPFLLLNDTADYSVYITTPEGKEERVYFYMNGTDRMQFIPAVLPRNNSKIIFQGDFPVDGDYKLRVQASDRTDNNSGSIDYIIGFEVINRSTITNIINYPNPFTTSTRFVFTLTGSEIPDIFKIQIMTITGKVVREVHKEELGALHIGRNISDFAWDGTDTYGDRLANGLYLYRVITKINSDDIEHRETSMDFYFKKGFGKMYLFR
ncbi:MAG: C25 family cysteine peptidase [Vicingaceae bacterium]|nr:C25 family cysteine peptidase [Vicingaceae bacterium]